MSVIACKITDNGYEIAADSISIRDWTQTKAEKDTKIAKLFEVNGMVIGGCGLMSELGLFRIFAETHKPSDATENALLEFLSEFANWKNDKTGEFEIENQYIIGIKNKAFLIYCWMIDEILTCEAIGAGSEFALTALHLGHDVKKAVEVTIKLCIYCEGPIKVIKK